MLKRTVDIFISTAVLLLLFPILFLFLFLIFFQDFHNPFYIAPRIGKGGVSFRMFKLRTMVIKADKSGVDSTSLNDKRITPLGSLIRRYKLD